MDILIATATLYGNKVRYLESNGQFRRMYASITEAPILFSDKKKMFQEWYLYAENLIITDGKLKEEYKRFTLKKKDKRNGR